MATISDLQELQKAMRTENTLRDDLAMMDDVEGYDPVTGRPSGEDAPKEYSFKDLLGSLDITRADDEPEYEGRKHGGKVRKTKKKAKSRKRAALRGWGKALRGY